MRVEELESRATPAVVGDLDPSFGGLRLAGFPSEFNAVTVQADGKVVVAGARDGDFLAARYNTDGTPDASFGTSGQVRIDIDLAGNADTATAVAIDAQGRIVLAGRGGTGDADFALVRLSANGQTVEINKSFPVGDADSGANALAFQSDGTLVLAGFGTFPVGVVPAAVTFAVIRVGPAGNPLGGATSIPFAGLPPDKAYAVAVFGPGPNQDKIVVAGDAGAADGAGRDDIAVARLSAAGAVETQANHNLGTNDRGRGVVLTTDGKILVGGYTNLGGGPLIPQFTLLRLNNDATLTRDTTFNPTGGGPAGSSGPGEARFDLGGFAFANSLVLDPNGRAVLAGTRGADFAVVRVNPDGSLDPTFAPTGGGKNVIVGPGNGEGRAVALDPGGRVVIAGVSNNLTEGVVIRLLAAVGETKQLAAGGTNGQAQVFAPDAAAGKYNPTPAATLTPFPGFAGSVRTAVGDIDGDRVEDTIYVTGPGTPIRVIAVSGASGVSLFTPFDPFGGDFTGGGFVAAADFDNDGRAEVVVTPDQGGGPRVSVFTHQPLPRTPTGGVRARANFLGIDDANFRGGARVAAGDVNGDGFPELVVAAGFGGGPRTAVFNGTTLFATPARMIADFFAFPGTDAVTLRNGVFVASGDINGDGFDDLVFGGGPGGAPRVFVLSGSLVAAGNVAGAQANPIANFFVAGNTADRGGVRVAVKTVDGDVKADVVAGSGEGSPSRVRVYLGRNFTTAAEPATFQDLDPFGAVLANGVFVG